MGNVTISQSKSKRTFVYLVVLSALALALAGCRRPDQVITLDQAMKNNCLETIIPGSSDELRVKQSLEGCKTIKYDTVIHSTGQIGSKSGTSYLWKISPTQSSTINLIHGVVNLITLQIEKGMNLGALVQEFGNPESIYVSYQTHENCVASIMLDYPDRGFSVGFDKAFDCSAIGNDGLAQLSLDESINVTEYYLYQANNLNAVLSNAFLMTDQSIKQNQNYRQPWPGFSMIQAKPLTQ